MKTLVYDTETTGFPRKGKTKLADQPYLIQIAAILFDNRRPVRTFASFVLPQGADEMGTLQYGTIPTSDFFIENGLTREVINEFGILPRKAIEPVYNMMTMTDRIVAHNASFDDQIIKFTLPRVNAPTSLWANTPQYCTMKTLEDEMKLPGKFPGKYKWPTLDEAYRYLIDPNGFSGAHDALVDVRACAKVLFACEDRGFSLASITPVAA